MFRFWNLRLSDLRQLELSGVVAFSQYARRLLPIKENSKVVEIDGGAESRFREDPVQYGAMLGRLGFTPATSGNLSVRLDEGRVLVTPTGVSKAEMKPEDMVIVDLNGRQLSGSRKVTSEIGMHLAVSQGRSDVRAVIHSHPPIATGFACAGRGLDEVLCQEAVMTLQAWFLWRSTPRPGREKWPPASNLCLPITTRSCWRITAQSVTETRC